MIRKVCFSDRKKKRFMQTVSVLQTKNRSGPAKKSVFCSPGPQVVTEAAYKDWSTQSWNPMV